MQVAGEAGQEPKPSQLSLRVVPLFETLADLQMAGDTMQTLFCVPWYRKYLRYGHLQCHLSSVHVQQFLTGTHPGLSMLDTISDYSSSK